MPEPRKPVTYMPNNGKQEFIITKKTLAHLEDYQNRIVTGQVNPGIYLLREINHFLANGKKEFDAKKPLTPEDRDILKKLKPADFMQLLMNTRIPQIYAESQATVGDGRMWNKDEFEISGHIGTVIKGVQVYDNGKYQTVGVGDGRYKDDPDEISVLCIPGPILKKPHTIDRDKLLKIINGKLDIDRESYKAFFKELLEMSFAKENEDAKKAGRNAFITMPGISNGAFAGEFIGNTIGHLSATIQELLQEHPEWENIGYVWLDGYNSNVCEDATIGNTKFRVRNTIRPVDKDGNEIESTYNKDHKLISGKPFRDLGQLSKAVDFAESEEEKAIFANCKRAKVSAWDQFSYIANDWNAGSRTTDEAYAASCNVLGVISGAPGQYRNMNPDVQKPPYAYYPPTGYRTWQTYFDQNNIKQSIADRLYVYDEGQFLKLESDREQQFLSEQKTTAKENPVPSDTDEIIRKSRLIAPAGAIAVPYISLSEPYDKNKHVGQPLQSVQFEFDFEKREAATAFIKVIKSISSSAIVHQGMDRRGNMIIRLDPSFILSSDVTMFQQAKPGRWQRIFDDHHNTQENAQIPDLDKDKAEKIKAFMYHYMENEKVTLDNIKIVNSRSVPSMSFGDFILNLTNEPEAPFFISSYISGKAGVVPEEQIGQVLDTITKDKNFIRLQEGIPTKQQVEDFIKLVNTHSIEGLKNRIGNMEFIGKQPNSPLNSLPHMVYGDLKLKLTGDPNKPIIMFNKDNSPVDGSKYNQILSEVLKNPLLQNVKPIASHLDNEKVQQLTKLLNSFTHRGWDVSDTIVIKPGGILVFGDYKLTLTNNPQMPFYFSDKNNYIIDPAQHEAILNKVLATKQIQDFLSPEIPVVKPTNTHHDADKKAPLPQQVNGKLEKLLKRIGDHISELGNRNRTDTEEVKFKALKMLRGDLLGGDYKGFTKFIDAHKDVIASKDQSKIKAGVFSQVTKTLFNDADELSIDNQNRSPGRP